MDLIILEVLLVDVVEFELGGYKYGIKLVLTLNHATDFFWVAPGGMMDHAPRHRMLKTHAFDSWNCGLVAQRTYG